KLEREGLPETLLAFPGKVRVDALHNRIFIADTGHNRVIEASLDSGTVQAVFGSGAPGQREGSFEQAELDLPEGMAYSPDGRLLYVADTGNNEVREINLQDGRVTTLIGTGVQADSPLPGTAPDVALNSPWALALAPGVLYIAMAGSHQIWRMDLRTKRGESLAGSGAEGAVDGPAADAALAQPSGVSLSPDGKRLYFANSEGSAIRYVELPQGRVVTLAGPTGSLFDYGDRNGTGRFALFQHPLGVVFYRGIVYAADTYNDKIKAINPSSGAVTTIGGGPGSGWRDGSEPLFSEPGGLDAADGKLYVADTNNHSIRVIDLATNTTSTLVLKGLAQLGGPHDPYETKKVRLGALSVAAGPGVVRLHVTFPSGYAANAEAPSEIALQSQSANVVKLTGVSSFSGAGPRFPMEFPAAFSPGETVLTVNLSIVYCREQEASVCLIHQARLEVPVTVDAATSAGGLQTLEVHYQVE
ncbi:MAG TPA: hypothetical protein VMW69_14135, partial [Spirochaetia bacterium]|nr:hypothetical protein [Spirochaetia bacterium]